MSIDSASAACILCGSNKPTLVASCGITPLAVTPTKTNLSLTAISASVVCGVFTQDNQCRPKLSTLVCGKPLTLISSIPAALVLMIKVSAPARVLSTCVPKLGIQPLGVCNNKGSRLTRLSASTGAETMPSKATADISGMLGI